MITNPARQRIGFSLAGAKGLGDQLIYSSFPENFFAATGTKLIDIDRPWFFDHNPFVVRTDEAPSLFINPLETPLPKFIIIDGVYRDFTGSVAERTMVQYGLDIRKLVLRHPRLYQFEGRSLAKRVVVHTKGVSAEQGMHARTMAHIAERYSQWEIVQIGAPTDTPFPGARDLRGTTYWETAQIISEAEVYIGVDSGPSWIAACYPRVQCKVILSCFTAEQIAHMSPMRLEDNLWHWYDASRRYYNESEVDMNFTYSYRKI